MLAGVPVHVIHRGNNRQDCFYKDQDRDFYLFHLGRQLARARCALHAYCLMTNHVHLLLTARSVDGCALLMKHVSQLHTQYVNKTYGRSGSLWEGRFRSCLVQSEEYLLACYRYIELNPVRAKLVREPRDYQWSSFRGHALGEYDPLVRDHEAYLALGLDPQERQAAYRALFDTELDPEFVAALRAATQGGWAFGPDDFKQLVAQLAGRRAEPMRRGRPPKVRGAV